VGAGRALKLVRNRGFHRCYGGFVSIAKDLYSAGNYWYGGYQHVTGAKDSPGWAMAGTGADFIGLMQPWGLAAGKAMEATKFVEAAETPIIEAGLLALMGMSNACGFAEPDQGQGFGQGSDAFQKIDDALGTTGAPETWTGDAAGAYSGQNGVQQKRARSLAEADRKIQHVLERQARQVKDTRDVIDHMTTVLTAAIIPAVAAYGIEFPPGAGVALSTEIQIAAVAATVPYATEQFGELGYHAIDNASDIRAAAQSYGLIGSESAPAFASADGQVTVSSGDLQHLSSQQDQIAEHLTTAGQTTSETEQNVFVSHGVVCAPASAAVASAVSARTNAAQTMHSISTELAGKLRHGASSYDGTDQGEQQKLQGQLPPR
jgi:EspA/EspE family/Excreted virulence factor EspC, type VII ESX diderm